MIDRPFRRAGRGREGWDGSGGPHNGLGGWEALLEGRECWPCPSSGPGEVMRPSKRVGKLTRWVRRPYLMVASPPGGSGGHPSGTGVVQSPYQLPGSEK